MRHFDIRYFYAMSKVHDQTVTAITYCLTKEIVVNYLCKLLQGSLFRTHQNSIMGINEQDEYEFYHLTRRKRVDELDTYVNYLYYFSFTSCHQVNGYLKVGVCWEIIILG